MTDCNKAAIPHRHFDCSRIINSGMYLLIKRKKGGKCFAVGKLRHMKWIVVSVEYYVVGKDSLQRSVICEVWAGYCFRVTDLVRGSRMRAGLWRLR